MTQNNISLAQQYIQEADAILITAGAGMGVDSGLPDFRGTEGFWKAYPKINELNIDFESMANPQWFINKPKLAWAFYGHRLNLYRDTLPHKGFEMLLELVQRKKDYFVYTSNVDGHFQKAGFPEEKIKEVHGSINYFQCAANCTNEIYKADSNPVKIDMDAFEAQTIPVCKHCNKIARPNILMFGDCDWNSRRANKQAQAYKQWLRNLEIKNKKLVIIEIGAGKDIPTIRNLGEFVTQNYKNSKLIRINPRDYQVDSSSGVSIALGGLEGLTSILQRLYKSN